MSCAGTVYTTSPYLLMSVHRNCQGNYMQSAIAISHMYVLQHPYSWGPRDAWSSGPQLRVLQQTCWYLPIQPIAPPPNTTTLLVARYKIWLLGSYSKVPMLQLPGDTMLVSPAADSRLKWRRCWREGQK